VLFIFLFSAKLWTHFLCQRTACTRKHYCWNVTYLTCWQQCLRNVNIWYWFNIIDFRFHLAPFQWHIPKTNSLVGRPNQLQIFSSTSVPFIMKHMLVPSEPCLLPTASQNTDCIPSIWISATVSVNVSGSSPGMFCHIKIKKLFLSKWVAGNNKFLPDAEVWILLLYLLNTLRWWIAHNYAGDSLIEGDFFDITLCSNFLQSIKAPPEHSTCYVVVLLTK